MLTQSVQFTKNVFKSVLLFTKQLNGPIIFIYSEVQFKNDFACTHPTEEQIEWLKLRHGNRCLFAVNLLEAVAWNHELNQLHSLSNRLGL